MKNILLSIAILLFAGVSFAQTQEEVNRAMKDLKQQMRTSDSEQFEQKLSYFTKELNSISKSRSNSESKKKAVLHTISDFLKDVTGKGIEDDRPIEPRSDLGELEGEKGNVEVGGRSRPSPDGESSRNLVLTPKHSKERIRNYLRELQMVNKNQPVLTAFAKQSVGEMKDRDFAFAVAIYEEVGIDKVAPQDLCRGGGCDKNEDSNGRIRGAWVYKGDAKFFMENSVWGFRYYCSYQDPLNSNGTERYSWKRKSNVGVW